MTWLESLREFRRSVLGLNRRNSEFVFRYNPRQLFHLVDNKTETKVALAAHGLPVPKTYAVFEVQWDLRKLGWAVRRLSDFVLKPARASGGGGILAITRHEGDRFYKASGACLSIRDLEDHVSDILAGAFSRNQRQDEAILEYRVRQDPAIGAMSFGGVADFRVLVFLGVPIMAMLRLPTRRSDGRANLHMGGIGVGVDLPSGRTIRATGPTGMVERHPDLGVPLVGVELPAWEQILEISTRCYEALGLGYFGADLVLDVDHGPMVLEVNGRPGLSIQLANCQGLRAMLEEIERRNPRALPVAERIRLGKEIFAAAANFRFSATGS